MNTLAKLDQLNLEPTAKTEVAALIQALIEQAERDAKTIQAKDAVINAKDIKISALTHELAYYKRIRFSTKSEALAPLQRDVFEETWNTCKMAFNICQQTALNFPVKKLAYSIKLQ